MQVGVEQRVIQGKGAAACKEAQHLQISIGIGLLIFPLAEGEDCHQTPAHAHGQQEMPAFQIKLLVVRLVRSNGWHGARILQLPDKVRVIAPSVHGHGLYHQGTAFPEESGGERLVDKKHAWLVYLWLGWGRQRNDTLARWRGSSIFCWFCHRFWH